MKVNIERDIDVNQLLINLNSKSQCKSVGMAGYEVTVNKQMLRDAHDVIAQLMKNPPSKIKKKYVVGDIFYFDGILNCNQRLCLKGSFFITDVNENTYKIKQSINDDGYLVFEDDLDSASVIIKNGIRKTDNESVDS